MIVVPEVTPHTLPKPSTVATEVTLLLQLPPVVPSANPDPYPAHTIVVPLIGPTVGNELTITTRVAATVPQVLVTV